MICSKLILFVFPSHFIPIIQNICIYSYQWVDEMFLTLFSALDAESEQIVQAALDNVVKGTCILELDFFVLVSSKNWEKIS